MLCLPVKTHLSPFIANLWFTIVAHSIRCGKWPNLCVMLCLHNSYLMGCAGKRCVRKMLGLGVSGVGEFFLVVAELLNAPRKWSAKHGLDQAVSSRAIPGTCTGWVCSLWKEECVLYKHLTPGNVSSGASRGCIPADDRQFTWLHTQTQQHAGA